MFLTYVRQLPMVEDNLDLSRGRRLEYSCGSIRRSRPNLRGYRAFVLEDKFRGVTYRVMEDGLSIEYGSGPVFVKNPKELKYTPFAVTGKESEINSFMLLCDRLVAEHKRRNSIRSRLRYFAREPVGMIIIVGGIIYAIATLIVLVLG